MRNGKYGVSSAEDRTFEGIIFHSRREMEAYRGFRILEKAGKIAKLERQVAFPLLAARLEAVPHGSLVDAVPVAKYLADFVVTELDGTKRIYETKGVATAVYKLKKKLFEANYRDLRIVEI